ncbi:hypothetical protein BDB00DRAFT_840367 [Zychaea mexicana]|uniref:uncharacterized protein n=1 Tax=Zychaea mexicana TaxID=64656 RepID=UPI0022FE82D5|nr:uncharacterized protein BDB00DRAFT_840367 [Zychaea mexicana]KAI9489986.1 hypothetical protein BDB00DRAFT_840367 [Zychaea mexicana]
MQPRNRPQNSPLRADSFELTSPTSRILTGSPGGGDGSLSNLREISASPITRNNHNTSELHSMLSDPQVEDSPLRMPFSTHTRQSLSLATDASNYQYASPMRMHRGLLQNLQEHSYQGNYTREDRLRYLRQDAAHQHLTKAATFFAEKVCAISDDFNDVYFLAQAYYQSHEYERALDLLNKKKTLNKSVQCRYLAGLCAIGLENWHDALDYLGPDNPFADKNAHAHIWWYEDSRRGASDGLIKLESMMCYARGTAYLQLREIEKAKNCFKEALRVDVKCYDALDALIEYNMLEEKAEWDFISTLPYEEHCGLSDADLFRSLYMIQLKRYSHTEDIQQKQKEAETEFGLKRSLDVMHSTARTLLAECKYEECLSICQEIRKEDALYTKSIPSYITCLYELKMKDELYTLAQELVDRLNDKAVTWHAVGMYYLYIDKYPEARRYFSQATAIDQYFEDSWLGYGHAFAAEKDHDQAISAYAMCSKLIPGSHLPYMYIGVQYMEQNMLDAAFEYLKKSSSKCKSDPFLLNEIATYHYRKAEYPQALDHLRNALKLAKDRQSPLSNLWERLWANFGHVYRRMRKYDRALKCFRLALDKNPQNSDVHAAIGLINHIQGKVGKALIEYYKALRNPKSDNFIRELIEKALLSDQYTSISSSVDDTDNIFDLRNRTDILEDYVNEELAETADTTENNANNSFEEQPSFHSTAISIRDPGSGSIAEYDEGDFSPKEDSRANMSSKDWL